MPDNFFSPDILNRIVVGAISAVTPIVLGSVWKLMQLITDHAELKGKVDVLAAQSENLSKVKSAHDTRLALVERAVTLMESISPVIRDLANVSSRLEALQEQTNRRLEMLENRANH